MAGLLARALAGGTRRLQAQEEEAARALAAKSAEGDDQEDENAEGDDQEDENAEGDDQEDENAEGDDQEDENAEGDDEEQAEGEEDDKDKSKANAAQSRERGRIAKILNAPAAKGRDALARHLALETNMSPGAAIAALKASPAGGKGRLAAAMNASAQPRLGPGGSDGGEETEAGATKRLAGYVNQRRAS